MERTMAKESIGDGKYLSTLNKHEKGRETVHQGNDVPQPLVLVQGKGYKEAVQETTLADLTFKKRSTFEMLVHNNRFLCIVLSANLLDGAYKACEVIENLIHVVLPFGILL